MMTIEQIKQIISEMKFRDWIFHVGGAVNGEKPYLQIQFYDKDFYTGKLELQKCRKWQLSIHMVPSELVRTARKALHTAMEHEVDETFTYKGVTLFHPHFDLDAMVEFAKKKKISVRS